MVEDREAFAVRCSARQRERQLGTGYGFGIFVDGEFAGEINLTSVQRGPFQNAYVGYWIDEAHAGQRLHARVARRRCCGTRFEELGLHRVQIAIIPRNTASRRVVEKLDIREEGIALRYLEINGVWEDHVRYAITDRGVGRSAATSCSSSGPDQRRIASAVFGRQILACSAASRSRNAGCSIDHTCGASSRLDGLVV